MNAAQVFTRKTMITTAAITLLAGAFSLNLQAAPADAPATPQAGTGMHARGPHAQAGEHRHAQAGHMARQHSQSMASAGTGRHVQGQHAPRHGERHGHGPGGTGKPAPATPAAPAS